MCEARLMSGQAIREDLTHTLRGWTWESRPSCSHGLSGGRWLGGLDARSHIARSCSVWCCQKTRKPGYARAISYMNELCIIVVLVDYRHRVNMPGRPPARSA